ncbi:MAG: phage terminase small subunit P27 family [Propionibacteriaceae bacterium]
MVRGKNPLPTNLKLVKGSPKSQINDDEPIPEEGIPTCPVRDVLVREVWDYTVEQLRKMRVITLADRDVLLAYCQAVIMHRRASEVLDRTGYLIEAEAGIFPHPAMRMQREAAMLMKQFASEFGLTPAARTRIKVGAQTMEEPKTAARLLSG